MLIVGKQGEQDVTLELAALGADLPDALPGQSIAFAFKHFQAIPEAGRFAELKLPEGFTPREIKVRAEVRREAFAAHIQMEQRGVTVPYVE